MRASEFVILKEDTTSLNQIYQNEFPDRDEDFWNCVNKNDLDKPLTVTVLSPFKLSLLLQSQYRIEHTDELFSMMDPEQHELVDHYANSNLTNSVIVICDGRIIDGNHRALAAVISNQSLKAVNVDELG